MLENHNKPWTPEDVEKLRELYKAGVCVKRICVALGRQQFAVYKAMRVHSIRAALKPKSKSERNAEYKAQTPYVTNALAGLRHCKDLRAAGYEPGFGELTVTPDGVPYNYQTQALVSSIYGSSGALCAEIGG